LGEGLGLDRAEVAQAGQPLGLAQRFLGGGRGYAIDHGGGKGHRVRDPIAERRVETAGIVECRGTDQPAIFGQIVATQNGKRRGSGLAAPAQCLHDQADRAGGLARIGEIARYGGMGGIDPARGAKNAIGLFRDGDADDADGGVGQSGQRPLRFARGGDGRGDATNDAGFGSVGSPGQHGVQPVLRRQRVDHIRSARAYGDDTPVAAFGGQRVVGVDRLVRAMKGTEPDMRDARPMVPEIVARPPHRRRQIRKASKLQSFQFSLAHFVPPAGPCSD
jgi:hypothetical protein